MEHADRIAHFGGKVACQPVAGGESYSRRSKCEWLGAPASPEYDEWGPAFGLVLPASHRLHSAKLKHAQLRVTRGELRCAAARLLVLPHAFASC